MSGNFKLFWHHDVSEEWLRERKEWLTATDLVGLLPEYGRYKRAKDKANFDCKMCTQLYGEKHSTGSVDTGSDGPAARGHIMEPYAIRTYNDEVANSPSARFFHVDDLLIYNPDNGLACSPDGLNNFIMSMVKTGEFSMDAYDERLDNTTAIIEIKSYDARKHIWCASLPKEKVQERYQIAASMLVLRNLSYGVLVFWNPSCDPYMDVKVYARWELKDEIEELSCVAGMYGANAAKLDAMHLTGKQCPYTEQQIWDEWHKQWETNVMEVPHADS